MVTILGLVIFSLLSESGLREFHGNLGWQVLAANYLLFLACLTDLLTIYRTEGARRWRWRIAVAAFLLHVAAGLVYLPWILTTGTFL